MAGALNKHRVAVLHEELLELQEDRAATLLLSDVVGAWVRLPGHWVALSRRGDAVMWLVSLRRGVDFLGTNVASRRLRSTTGRRERQLATHRGCEPKQRRRVKLTKQRPLRRSAQQAQLRMQTKRQLEYLWRELGQRSNSASCLSITGVFRVTEQAKCPLNVHLLGGLDRFLGWKRFLTHWRASRRGLMRQ